MKNSEINKIAKYVNKVFEKNNSSSGDGGGSGSNNTSYPSDLVTQDFVENKIAEEIAKAQLGGNGGEIFGLTGPTGPIGPTGPTGATGKDGLTTKVEVNGQTYEHINGTITLDNVASKAYVEEQIETVDDKFDGLRFKRITQEEYDTLAVKDPNTLYIIINS